MMIKLRKEPTFLELLEWFLRYVYHARTEDKETLKRIIDREIKRLNTEGAKEMAMTVAEQIRKEAWNEGAKQSLKKTALNMLNMGMDIKIISQATGLSEEEIKQLITQKEQKKWQ